MKLKKRIIEKGAKAHKGKPGLIWSSWLEELVDISISETLAEVEKKFWIWWNPDGEDMENDGKNFIERIKALKGGDGG